ncbi:hypothetical protein EPI10_005350 [Gossypium australe]|uniref:Uncharacterized protein n=1 Tax=Gossypium australe TaxID=47621 RepID=A0A5B6WQD3_9ROSI|nr:hypothetical protein EPI10_005350 [Gossypium australe]
MQCCRQNESSHIEFNSYYGYPYKIPQTITVIDSWSEKVSKTSELYFISLKLLVNKEKPFAAPLKLKAPQKIPLQKMPLNFAPLATLFQQTPLKNMTFSVASPKTPLKNMTFSGAFSKRR